MNQRIKRALMLVSLVVLFTNSCDAPYLDQPDPAASDVDPATLVERSQAEQVSSRPAEPDSGVTSQDVSKEDVLDRVNRGGPQPAGSGAMVGTGPEPGSESVLGQGEPSDGVESESIPTETADQQPPEGARSFIQAQTPISPTGPIEVGGDVDLDSIPTLEERDAILDRVNRGGPQPSGGGKAPVAGPVPGTESRLGPLVALLKIVRHWWQELFH